MGKRKSKQDLSPEIFALIVELFDSENWKKHLVKEEVKYLDIFCEMLSDFDKEEQRLLIELANSYIDIPPEDYSIEVLKLLKQFVSQFNNVEHLYIMPIVNDSDYEKNKIKSSHFISYLFKNKEYRHINELKKLTVYLIPEISNLGKTIKTSGKKSFVIVDDFIGTGETLQSCLNRIKRSPIKDDLYLDPSDITIMSIACTKKVKEEIEDQGYKLVCNHIIDKGITDNENYSDTERAKYIEIMGSIENKLSIDSNLRLGRNNSEALISLARTPNNTFPVFWKCTEDYMPIFPRWGY